jgi:uncharacterized membrane protein YgcG
VLATIAFVLALTFAGRALAYTPPPIVGYVTDTAHKLTPGEIQAFDEKLAVYRKCSTNHVVVFVTDSLGGNTVEDVGYATFNAWKVGSKEDNGVLLLIAPNERKVRIETGKGAGGALTDVESNRILREHVSANLKKEHFFEAIDEGTTEIERALERDAKPLTDGAASCPVTPATRPPPSTTPTTVPRQSSPTATTPPPAPAVSESMALPVATFWLVALSVLIVGFPLKRPLLSFEGCVGLALTVWITVFLAVLLGFFATVAASLVGAPVAGVVLAALSVPLVVVGRIFLPKVTNRPFFGSSRSSDSSDSTSGSSSSSASSSWDSGGSSSSSSDTSSSSSSSSGSSGSDTSYSGGSGSSGGGGSSDSY